MKECKCKPAQKLPHITSSGGGKTFHFVIPYWTVSSIYGDNRRYRIFNNHWVVKRFNNSLFHITKFNKYPRDCNGQDVKHWGYIFIFGVRFYIW